MGIIDTNTRIKIVRYNEDGSLFIPKTPVEAIGLMRRGSYVAGNGGAGRAGANLPGGLVACAEGVGEGGGGANPQQESSADAKGVDDGDAGSNTKANLLKESAHAEGTEDGGMNGRN